MNDADTSSVSSILFKAPYGFLAGWLGELASVGCLDLS